MSKSFQKGKPRQAKINGQWIFGDFSEGLYLLDTPRSITEQLGSLALVGGRNTFCERGALIPQYGYVEKARIDNEYIVAISKDVESGYLFLLANTGNVFIYTPNEGLKKFKTQLTEVSENALMTCRQDELIISDNGVNILFGKDYEDVATVTTAITQNAPITTYAYFSDFKIPNEDLEYYWLGKEINIAGIGKAKVASIKEGEKVKKEKPFTFNDLSPSVNWKIEGSIDLTKQEVQEGIYKTETIKLGSKSSIYGQVGGEDTTYEVTTYRKRIHSYAFKNPVFSYSKLFVDNGRTSSYTYYMKVSPETDKIYIRPELIEVGRTYKEFTYSGVQSGQQEMYLLNKDKSNYIPYDTPSSEYSKDGYVDNRDVKIYRVNSNDDVELNYHYKYKFLSPNKITQTNSASSIVKLERLPDEDIIVTESETHTETGVINVASIRFTLPSANGERTREITGLAPDVYNYSIEFDPTTGNITINITASNQILPPEKSTIVLTENSGTLEEYYLSSTKSEIVGGGNSGIVLYVNGESKNYDLVPCYVIRASHQNTENTTLSDTVTISEKCYQEVDWVYNPEEDSPEESRTINPKLISWVCNRLFVEDMNGEIYYSEVGLADSFDEASGAGYFYGFYGDNSELLSIEEFLGKVLITKRNGMYTLVIGQTNSSYSTVAGTGVDTSGITIEKIAEIGQEYPTDHVIVKEAIYAYDTNSASIVQAASQNVFGSIVAGTTLISADYLNAQNFGILDRKRCLTYNSEAQVFILYFGEDLTDGIVLTSQGSLFPRKLDRYVQYFIGFNQGVLGIMGDGTIFQDFKRNTVIPEIKPVAEFEAIGVKDNRLLMGSILEVTELNGIEYDILVTNTDSSFQHIQPYTNYGIDGLNIPPLLYSDARDKYPSFELTTKWAVKKSNLTRVYAPMSGREGVSITFTFPENVAFCLAALRIPDFSQGE